MEIAALRLRIIIVKNTLFTVHAPRTDIGVTGLAQQIAGGVWKVQLANLPVARFAFEAVEMVSLLVRHRGVALDQLPARSVPWKYRHTARITIQLRILHEEALGKRLPTFAALEAMLMKRHAFGLHRLVMNWRPAYLAFRQGSHETLLARECRPTWDHVALKRL